MKTKIYSLLLALSAVPVFSQVGINTSAPAATLDVNGNVKVRTTPAAPALTGYQILGLNTATAEVAQVDPQLLINSATTAANTNTTVFAAKKTTGISLLSLSLFPTGFRVVNFLAAERSIGSAALFGDTDHNYTIPSTGVYAIGFSFRYGTGLQASILANSPGIGIFRDRGGVGTIIDSRAFSGANLILLSLTISETSINSVYSLQAGDKISFGLTGSSLLDGGLLGSSVGSFFIYKISN